MCKKLITILLFIGIFSCSIKEEKSSKVNILQERVDAYSDVDINLSLAHLTKSQQKVIKELIAAARQADTIFWKQSSHDAVAIREAHKNATPALQKYIMINFGPYDRVHVLQRFVGNGPDFKPKGAGFYPESISREVFEAYVAKNPEQKESLEDQYTVVVSEGNKLKAIPYSQIYNPIYCILT